MSSEVISEASDVDSSVVPEDCCTGESGFVKASQADDGGVSWRRKQQTGTSVLIAPDLLSRPNIVSLATRLKMTATQQATCTQGVIAESGGDVSMVAISYATANRSRCKVVADIAMNIRQNWIPPKLCTLHWDTKLMPTLKNQHVTEERVTVIVSDSTQLKLLGVPGCTKATDQTCGAIIADLTVKLTDEWHCSDKVVNMTFDTTSSNTGHLTAACIAIQNKLQRALLWSGCRRHIGEVILSHVFEDLKTEISQSPNVSLVCTTSLQLGLSATFLKPAISILLKSSQPAGTGTSDYNESRICGLCHSSSSACT